MVLPPKNNRIRSLLKGDIRVEVVSAYLMDIYKNISFFFRPKSIFRRNYRKDIIAEYIEFGEDDVFESVHWDISRNGIYDTLPEGVFHQNRKRKAFRSVNEMIALHKKQKQEEEDARLFFLPIEQSIYEQRLLLELEERKVLSGFNDRKHQEILKQFWGFEVDLSRTQLTSLIHILPLAQRLIGNWDLTAQCFSLVLDQPVHIELQHQAKQKRASIDTPGLGEASLGIDTILGKEFDPQMPFLHIQLGPIPQADLPQYLPNAAGRKLLDMLCEFFLPLEAEIRYDISIDQGPTERIGDPQDIQHSTTLGFKIADKVEHEGRLGYTTILK